MFQSERGGKLSGQIVQHFGKPHQQNEVKTEAINQQHRETQPTSWTGAKWNFGLTRPHLEKFS